MLFCRTVFQVQNLTDAILSTLFLSLLVCASQICHAAFNGKPLGQYLIEAGYDIVVFVTTGSIIFLLS